jgi:hypothetical protein
MSELTSRCKWLVGLPDICQGQHTYAPHSAHSRIFTSTYFSKRWYFAAFSAKICDGKVLPCGVACCCGHVGFWVVLPGLFSGLANLHHDCLSMVQHTRERRGGTSITLAVLFHSVAVFLNSLRSFSRHSGEWGTYHEGLGRLFLTGGSGWVQQAQGEITNGECATKAAGVDQADREG